MSGNFEKLTKEELIKYINELRRQLNNEKYGLYFDRKASPEDVIEESKNKIPILYREKSLDIISGKYDENLLIEGDNFQVLSALTSIAGSDELIDVIYIDPPYNTGNKDFIYNDKFLDVDDGFRHTKWLNFMEKRLKLAKELLSENGVIFISIDDNEQSQLKLLCDSIFGERNHITTFVWEKTQHFGRQKINNYSNNEYVLCYAKQLVGDKIKELLVESINTELQDAPLYNASNPVKTLEFPTGSVLINLPDGTYNKTTNDDYLLEKPVIVKNKKNLNPLILTFRSRWSNETVQIEFEKGTTYWVKTKNFAIRTIYHEGKTSKTSPKQLIFSNINNPLVARNRFGEKVGVNEEGSKELKQIVQNDLFSYPKPVSLIKYLLSLIYDPINDDFNKNFTCLDFFAGSGTTGQAILELNQLDGGNRKFILVTNNEGNIMSDVCYPRIKTVVTGIRQDGTKYSDGINTNVRYLKASFADDNPSKDQAKYDLVEQVDSLICITEQTYDHIYNNNNTFNLYTSIKKDKITAIYNDYYEKESFNDMLDKIVDNNIKDNVVYYFSLDNNIDEALEKLVKDKLPNATVKPIPSKIYEIYKKIAEDLRRDY